MKTVKVLNPSGIRTKDGLQKEGKVLDLDDAVADALKAKGHVEIQNEKQPTNNKKDK